jgi:hypothetical protein
MKTLGQSVRTHVQGSQIVLAQNLAGVDWTYAIFKAHGVSFDFQFTAAPKTL